MKPAPAWLLALLLCAAFTLSACAAGKLQGEGGGGFSLEFYTGAPAAQAGGAVSLP